MRALALVYLKDIVSLVLGFSTGAKIPNGCFRGQSVAEEKAYLFLIAMASCSYSGDGRYRH